MLPNKISIALRSDKMLSARDNMKHSLLNTDNTSYKEAYPGKPV